MNVHAAHGYHCQIGRKCFNIDFIRAMAIQCVTGDCRKLFQIDMIDAVANFFVAGE